MVQGTLILDRYRIVGTAGAGGYATVFRAYDTHLKRDVAIKRIELSAADVEHAQRIAQEATEAMRAQEQARIDAVNRMSAKRIMHEAGILAMPGEKLSFGEWASDGTHPVPTGPSYPQEPAFLDALDEHRARRRTRLNAAEVRSAHGGGANEHLTVPLGQTAGAPTHDPDTANASFLNAGGPSESSLTTVLATVASAPSSADSAAADPFAHIPGLKEARTIAQLNDANIVTVYDCELHGTTVYIIMEYIEGKTLAQLMNELKDDIDLDIIAAIFTSVAHALEVAHAAHVLHLDIKPENVVINSKGIVKVTDFGLSTLVDASGHGTAGGGTIGYMPLEQMRQQKLDGRTDEWALASLTYEMLSGVNPFFADSLKTAETAIEDAELVLPSLCWESLDRRVDDIMFAALHGDVDERYDTVAEFAEALAPYLGNVREGTRILAATVQGAPLEAATEKSDDDAGEYARDAYGAGTAKAHANLGDRLAALRERTERDSQRPRASSAPAVRELRTSRDRHESDHDRPSRDSRDRSSSRSQPVASRDLNPAKPPLLDRIGDGGGNLIMRGSIMLGAALMTAVALVNIRFDPSAVYGLASGMVPVFWVLLLGVAALSAFLPSIGILAAYVLFVIMLCFNGAFLVATALAVAFGAWWWMIGRYSLETALTLLAQPLFGSVGMGSASPVLSGMLLSVIEAGATALCAAVSAFAFASLGSGDLTNWMAIANALTSANASISSANINNTALACLASPLTWCVAGSWVLAAVAYAVLCIRGTLAFDVIGAVLAAIILMAGMLVGTYLANGAISATPLQMAGALVPGAVGILFAALGIADRARSL